MSAVRRHMAQQTHAEQQAVATVTEFTVTRQPHRTTANAPTELRRLKTNRVGADADRREEVRQEREALA